MGNDVHDGDVESQDVDQPIEIVGESPRFRLAPGQGRLELFVAANGILRFTTIVVGTDGRLYATNETGSNSFVVGSSPFVITRDPNFFKGYAGQFLSGTHCTLVYEQKEDGSVELIVQHIPDRPRNGTYYKHYES